MNGDTNRDIQRPVGDLPTTNFDVDRIDKHHQVHPMTLSVLGEIVSIDTDAP